LHKTFIHSQLGYYKSIVLICYIVRQLVVTGITLILTLRARPRARRWRRRPKRGWHWRRC